MINAARRREVHPTCARLDDEDDAPWFDIECDRRLIKRRALPIATGWTDEQTLVDVDESRAGNYFNQSGTTFFVSLASIEPVSRYLLCHEYAFSRICGVWPPRPEASLKYARSIPR